MLHLTHGSAANERLEAVGIPGRMASWDDNLHEGPVPSGLDLDGLDAVRAEFLAGCGYVALGEAARRLAARNRLLRSEADDGGVYVWTSPELYDQLQLWQILDWFAGEGRERPPPFLIAIDGLFSQVPAAALSASFASARRADETALAAAADLWARFRSPDPRRLADVNPAQAPLPHLQSTLPRLLEEYPDQRTGLCRSQRQILRVLSDGPTPPGALFQGCQALEETPFMGDWSFWRIVAELIDGEKPAARRVDGGTFVFPPGANPGSDAFRAQRIGLTAFGERLLAREGDFIAANGIDRWLGGAHLITERHWRWNGAALARYPR